MTIHRTARCSKTQATESYKDDVIAVEMNTGVIVVLDILGFKRLAEKMPESLIEKMETLAAEGEKPDVNLQLDPGIQRKILVFSDTAIVASHYSGEEGTEPSLAMRVQTVYAACLAAANILAYGASEPDPSFCFRGCVAAGPFLIQGTTLIGAAVDEAAEYHQRAEGGLVWWTPSAFAYINSLQSLMDAADDPAFRKLRFMAPLYVGCNVHLKGGQQFYTGCVSPFGAAGMNLERMRTIRERISKSFQDGSLDNYIKGQHTDAFLNDAQRLSEDIIRQRRNI